MNSMISCSRLLAAVLCGAVLAGCNAVEDVREEPFVEIPPPTAVLQGTITGLGSRRPVVLQNNGLSQCVDRANPAGPKVACSFLATIGAPVTPFTFDAIPEGTPYDITVKTQPFGKICSVSNGQGVASLGAAAITVNCVNDPAVPRYFVQVTVPAAFVNAPGAKVTLSTEEGVFEQVPAAGATTVRFDSAVFNSLSSLPLFQYTVSASTTEGSTETSPLVNKCAVTNPTNVNASAEVVPPTTNVTNPVVGLCRFTLGGTVGYSTPVGGTPQTMPAGGLKLQLRDVKGVVVEELNFTAGYGASGTTAGGTPTNFTFTTLGRSNTTAVYDVAVSSHPAGQYCVVSGGGAATLSVTGTTNPANLTTINVRCRARPANAASTLRGTYQITTLTVLAPATGTTTPLLTTTTSDRRSMMTFFEDGTFLFGNRITATSVEQGFYTYNVAQGRLYFTIISDSATTGGLSVASLAPGPVVVGAVTHQAMADVVKTAGERGTMSGTFGALGTTVTANRTSWVMTEPRTVLGQMTGTWVTADHRRAWSYDFNTTYGFHTGANGGAFNLSDACYTLDDYTAASGYYTRRGGITGCLSASGATVDYIFPSLATLPGYIGRMPGSESAADGRSPSPIYFTVTPGTPDTLTVQSSLHGVLINEPVVFVRENAN